MGLFDGLGAAKPRMNANYVRPCHILARIDGVKASTNRKDEAFFAVEMTTLEDLAPEKFSRADYGHEEGEEVSHLMMKKHESFLSNVKGFLMHAGGCSEEEANEAAAAMVCSEDQPLTNTIIEVKAQFITTQAGNLFTVVDYSKGVVSPADALARWQGTEQGQRILERFFPNNLLEELAKALED